MDQAPATIALQITGGLIAHYRDRGHVRVELFKLGGTSATGEKETLVAQDRSVPPDGVERTVQLKVREAGLYRIVINDGDDRTLVTWTAGLPMTVEATEAAPLNRAYGSWEMYFYVPKGTRTVGLFG